MPLNSSEIRRFNEGCPPKGIADGRVIYTLPINADELGEFNPNTESVAPQAVGSKTPLKGASLYVKSLVVRSGPRDDGVTPNVGLLFVGGNGITQGSGWPLNPGESLAMGGVDLSKVFFIAQNIDDRLRIVYFA